LALGNVAGEDPAAVAVGQVPGRRAEAAGDLQHGGVRREEQIVRHGPDGALLGVAQRVQRTLEQSQMKVFAPDRLHGDAKAAGIEVLGFG
jgi:hypothetical protein